jgi:hypothetical protein
MAAKLSSSVDEDSYSYVKQRETAAIAKCTKNSHGPRRGLNIYCQVAGCLAMQAEQGAGVAFLEWVSLNDPGLA